MHTTRFAAARGVLHAGLAVLLTAVLAGAAAPALAQQDRSAEKAARRQQQQMQALQQQVSQAQAEKAKIEQDRERDRAAVDKQLQARSQAAARALAGQRTSDERLKALQAEQQQLAARVAELEKAAEDQRRQAEIALAGKDRELAQAAQAQARLEADRGQWQQRFGEQARAVVECTDKNERLVALSAELLNRWQGKGVFDALREREPVLGWNDVQIFNLVQDYRDKTDSERFVPRVERR